MADNKIASIGTQDGATFVTAQLSWSGDTADATGGFLGILTGSEGAWTYDIIVGGAGVVTAGTQRVTLASDDPAVTALELIDNAVSGSGFNISQLGGASVPIGTGLEATAVRVTIATDSSGVVSIDDNGGSLTVDLGSSAVDVMLGTDFSSVLGSASLVATDGSPALTIGLQALGTDGVNAQILSTNTNGHVNIADGGNSITVDNGGSFAVQVDSLVPGTGATNLGKAIDSAAGATDTGVVLLAKRVDSPTTITPIAGDWTGLQVNVNGSLWTRDNNLVTVLGTASVISTSGSDDQSNTSTRVRTAANGYYFDGTTWDRVRGNATDGMLVNLGTNNDVTVTGTVTVGSHAVTNAGVFAVQESGDALTALQKIDDPVATISATPLMRVAIFDAADGQITSFGGGTEYTEDAVAPANPVTKATGLVRQDTPAGLTSTDGDVVAQRGTNYGAAFCQILDSSGNFIDTFGGSGGTATTDDGAFTAAVGQGTPIMGFATADPVDAGDVGVLAMDTNRNLKVILQSNTGVDVGDVDVTSVVPGTGATNLGKAEDSASGLTDTGVAIMGVITNSPSSLGYTVGDYAALRVTNEGMLWTLNNDRVTSHSDTYGNANAAARVASFPYVFNGTTWDRQLGNATDGALVNLGANNDVTVTGTVDLGATDNAVLDTIASPVATISATPLQRVAIFDAADTQITSFGGGTQYTEGATDATITGTAVMWEDAADTLVAASATKPLPVDLGANNDVTVTSGNITVSGTVTANAGSGTYTVDLGANNDVQGQAAHDAAVSGNPLVAGARARTTNPTAVADADATYLFSDDLGKLVTVANAPRDLVVQNTVTLTNTTETTLITAGAAGVFHDLTQLFISSGDSAVIRVDIRDATAGTVRMSQWIAANGGGAVLRFDPPLAQTTAANNWTVQLSGTPAANDVRVFAQVVKNV